MPNILPVSDLRNYNEVLKNCHKGEPLYLTKNGRGRFVVQEGGMLVLAAKAAGIHSTRLYGDMDKRAARNCRV